jgi:DNA-binding CsgD family transcriptional regulator
MEPFDLAQDFIESTTASGDPKEVASRFVRVVERLGFEHFACCSHVDPLNPPTGAVLLHNYPREWQCEFYERGFYRIDPVLQYAEQTLIPFHWNDPAFLRTIDEQQRSILMRARECGLHHGFTVPIHLPWRPALSKASCSIVADSPRVAPESYQVIHLISLYLYNAISHHAPFTPRVTQSSLRDRERQCLELVAQGKSDWIIGQLLNISEHTVHRHIETAKRRLGVSTRVQAILRAIDQRQLSFGDVIRSDKPREER